MEQLVTIRRRIKTVETIKKITNAMRLISMSTHTRLRAKKEYLENYKKTFEKLSSNIGTAFSEILKTKKSDTKSERKLIILVGSQKGLCGSFNSFLFKFLQSHLNPLIDDNHDFISVGKNATDFLVSKNIKPIHEYSNFSSTNFVYIANAITSTITNEPDKYKQIVIFSNKSKSFFLQQPNEFKLLPIEKPNNDEQKNNIDYLIEQSPKEINDTIEQLIIAVTIQEKLFESLIAEQSARFLLMDSATRNAENLLTSMKLGYNKLRQATITRELTELSSSY